MKVFALAAAAVLVSLAGAGNAADSAATVAPQAAQALVIEPAAIDAALKGMVDSQKIIGVSALVFQGNKEVYFGAFGLADRETKPMTRDTIVQISSMTADHGRRAHAVV
jgi:CubicO group peptidase (beta-lactamase class C family)